MARQTKTFKIDGETYVVRQLTTTVGIPLGHRLVKAFGPTIREFVKSLPKGGLSEFARQLLAGNVEEERLEQLFVVLLEAVEGCPTPLLGELGASFSEQTTIQAAGLTLPLSSGDIYDEHFAGRPGLWLKWVAACVQFNFAGFFTSSPRSAATATESPTPTA